MKTILKKGMALILAMLMVMGQLAGSAGTVYAAQQPQDGETPETTAETMVPSETETETTVPSETEAETTAPAETEAETTAPAETETETTVPSETEAETTAPAETETETTAPTETIEEATVPAGTSSVSTAALLSVGIPVDAAHFPDANFRSYVSANIDTDSDGILSQEEQDAVTYIFAEKNAGTIESEKISSLEGIQYFQFLETLDCSYNNLTVLDLSGNPVLMNLYCNYNPMTSLDVSGCTALQSLSCSFNRLTSLNINGCTALQDLTCCSNQLTNLDVNSCTALQSLSCNDNKLPHLDVSGCTALQNLSCNSNQLTSLCASGCTVLTKLDYRWNSYTAITDDGTLPLSSLPGFELQKASNWTGGQVKNGVLTPNSANQPVTYDYNCGNGQTTRFSILVQKSEPQIAFEDVPADLYCFDAVNWAVQNGITNGTDATHFTPHSACKRRHAVMFLWRSVGCPEPASMQNPFVDVKSDRFEKPILWAYYAGITTGKDAAHFQPEVTCSRKQILTFLWRLNGQPDPHSTPDFPDVKMDRFLKPICWAVENGISGGYKDGTFRPDNNCTRGQIVTFLYRSKLS